jgi:hypothetical protein
LLEYIQQALFFRRLLYSVSEWDCHDVGIFAMIQVMAAKKGYD